jgi:hypothetical protein
MGLSISPDMFQEKMSELMAGLEIARAYLDDLWIVSTEKGFDKHLEKLEQVLEQLQEAGLKINAEKNFFARTNLEYLGYDISREGIRPSQEESRSYTTNQSTNHSQTSKTIYWYGKLLQRHVSSNGSHSLAMTSAKVKWKWTPECQEAFEQMKALIAKETLVTFPDFTKEFEIHTDASKLQLGACIS